MNEDLIAIEKKRLEIERLRVESEFADRERKQQEQEKVKKIRNILADATAMFEELRRLYP